MTQRKFNLKQTQKARKLIDKYEFIQILIIINSNYDIIIIIYYYDYYYYYDLFYVRYNNKINNNNINFTVGRVYKYRQNFKLQIKSDAAFPCQEEKLF